MPDLMHRLCSEAYEFDFFQAVTLVCEHLRSEGARSDPLTDGRIAFSSDTSMSFPPSDIAAIRTHERGAVQFILSFMGMTGVSSPLPSYFTEYCTLHGRDDRALGDFLTIFDNRLYTLFFLAWKKYRMADTTPPADTFGLFRSIARLAGTIDFDDPRQRRLLAYAGFFSGPCRSAQGLRTMIAGLFDGIPVRVAEFFPRRVRMADPGRIGVNTVLGRTAMLGEHVTDTSGKFRIIIGPLEKVRFSLFLPDTEKIAMIRLAVDAYCSDPLSYDIEVRLQPEDLKPVVLGRGKARLGISSGLGETRGSGREYRIVVNGRS